MSDIFDGANEKSFLIHGIDFREAKTFQTFLKKEKKFEFQSVQRITNFYLNI